MEWGSLQKSRLGYFLLLYLRRLAWSGVMQTVHQDVHPGKSSILFLPMIDVYPSSMTCIFSTLTYVCKQARKYNVTLVVTFDQPLFWKAMLIIESEPTLEGPKKSCSQTWGTSHTEELPRMCWSFNGATVSHRFLK